MKNSILVAGLLLSGIFIISCNNQSGIAKNETKEITSASVAQTDTTKFTADMVDNKRDPSCGMPITAGIGDTAHYKNKVLGFCSKECKDEFLKDPEKNIAAADLKK